MMALSTLISVIKPVICGMAAALSWIEVVSKNSSFMMEAKVTCTMLYYRVKNCKILKVKL